MSNHGQWSSAMIKVHMRTRLNSSLMSSIKSSSIKLDESGRRQAYDKRHIDISIHAKEQTRKKL